MIFFFIFSSNYRLVSVLQIPTVSVIFHYNFSKISSEFLSSFKIFFIFFISISQISMILFSSFFVQIYSCFWNFCSIIHFYHLLNFHQFSSLIVSIALLNFHLLFFKFIENVFTNFLKLNVFLLCIPAQMPARMPVDCGMCENTYFCECNNVYRSHLPL